MKIIKFMLYLFMLSGCQQKDTSLFINYSWQTSKNKKVVIDTVILNSLKQKYSLKEINSTKFNYLPLSIILTDKNRSYGIKNILPYVEIVKDTFSTPLLIAGLDMYRGPEDLKILLYDSLPSRYIDLLQKKESFDIIKKINLPYKNSFTYGNFKVKGIKNRKTWFSGISLLKKDFETMLNKFHPSGLWILIKKSDFSLSLYRDDELLKKFTVCIGKNEGDKKRVGDMKTPEGFFYIVQIQDSHTWTHDFKDGKGPIKGAYGPWFLRLYTGKDATFSGKGWTGIGIHGTHNPASIGTRDSEGCIRLKNENLLELYRYVKVGIPVFIVK